MDLGTLYHRGAMRRSGLDPIELAPFGVEERELGQDAFARLLYLVDTYRFLTARSGQADAPPEMAAGPLEDAVLRDDDAERTTPAVHGASRLVNLGGLGFVAGAIIGSAIRSGADLSGPTLYPLILFALLGAGVGVALALRSIGRVRDAGLPVWPFIVALAASAIGGAVIGLASCPCERREAIPPLGRGRRPTGSAISRRAA